MTCLIAVGDVSCDGGAVLLALDCSAMLLLLTVLRMSSNAVKILCAGRG